ncbi:MAG: acyl carrier protein [Epsilonproteobacteria bacterium]|nr:acyl carrier protein [Campylobacterota bacterium]
MKKEEFLDLLAETIDTEEELSEQMSLDDIDEYDSIAILSLMSMYDELGVKVTPNDFKDLKTVADLIKLAGDRVE